MDEQKQKILDFMQGHTVGVISTVTKGGQPQGAAVEFAETEELNIVFNTFTTYRKYENLMHNPRVAFTIGYEHDITVQYEGTAKELSGDDLAKYKAHFTHKIPDAPKWDAFPETRYFLVTPTWIRYSNLKKESKEVFVVKF